MVSQIWIWFFFFPSHLFSFPDLMMITKKRRRRRRKREKQFGYRRFSQRAHAGGFLFSLPPFLGFWIICFTKEDGKEREKWARFSSFPRLIRPGSPSFFVYFLNILLLGLWQMVRSNWGNWFSVINLRRLRKWNELQPKASFFPLLAVPQKIDSTRFCGPKKKKKKNWNVGGVNARSNNMRGEKEEEEAALIFPGQVCISVCFSYLSAVAYIYLKHISIPRTDGRWYLRGQALGAHGWNSCLEICSKFVHPQTAAFLFK